MQVGHGMQTFSTARARADDLGEFGSPPGLEALPSWLRLVVADLVTQVLECERAALRAATAAITLETSVEGRARARAQRSHELRDVAFFLETQQRLGFERPVNPHLTKLMAAATRSQRLAGLLMGANLVVEPLGQAILDASIALLVTQSESRFFPLETRTTLGELAVSMECLRSDEGRHLAFGVLRLRDERSHLSAAGQHRLDAEARGWRASLAELFRQLPLLVLLRPWLEVRPTSVLAHFDARARAAGVASERVVVQHDAHACAPNCTALTAPKDRA